ncbi:NADH dehydrogenase (quinone) [Thioalkalivibrio nitratireducens DSM 14787]|uniref:NADH dehydrogenase (Quinone) n=1 Tax=Thioalkalivibrio nitratireducens (strain DSM 14787 / UNIQEM 213 / ALEN2) TaxID=1255043 RepID=L0DTW0_THIND|nr:proton-conducting transporter membrane subunit [Thioalkalivibrio nitratireducens]AGA31806.1 NADH dehydrogenase (quinone) [Thioalkalivibrio nitratireducens DSM 14787]
MIGLWSVPLLFALPLALGILTLLATPAWRPRLSLAGLPLLLAASAAAFLDLALSGPGIYRLGDWPAPLGINLNVDGLSAGMVVMTAVVAALCAAYARSYLRDYPASASFFWPLFWFLWAGMNGIWLAEDIFNLYVGLEVMGLAAVGMVALRATPQALAAAMRYLLAALLGSLAYLLGVALLYGAYGTLSMAGLQHVAADNPTTQVALALIILGLLLKTALFPLHAWLPPAHGGALTPVSALLSALVVKGSFYILLRLWLVLGPEVTPAFTAQLLGVLGAGAVFYGGWMAWRQHLLKQLVAYSTVAQIGYLFLFFPLVTGTGAEAARLAWDGTMMMLVAHALAKAALFLSAGNLILAVGSSQIGHLVGISRFRPLSLFSFGLAGVSLMGLPPSGGFTGKWLLLHSAILSGQWWWLIVLFLGGLLSAAYIFKVFRMSFREGPQIDRSVPPPLTMDVAAMILAASAIVIGLTAHLPLHWLRAGALLGGG